VQALIRYALLHDFVHTDRHPSKIYVEVPLAEQEFLELLQQHHGENDNPLVRVFQQYDQRAAQLTRRIRAPTTDRYNWQAKNAEIDFTQLASEITQVSENVWKLYDYIYQNHELAKLTESLKYGHSSLKTHLLLIANLIVQDWLAGKLVNLNHGREAVKNQNGQNAVAG
jgi:hypothetical protein